MIKSKPIAIVIFIIYLFSFSYAIAISPGILHVNYKPNEKLNLSFKIVNIENKDDDFILYSDSKFINIPNEINISENEKEKTINFTLQFLKEKISREKINIYIIEKKSGNKIFAREGVKLSIIIHNITESKQNIAQKEVKEEVTQKKEVKKEFENESQSKEFANKTIKEKIEKFEIVRNFIKIIINPVNLIKIIIFKNS